MRYILDNEGYVELCSKTHIECNGRGCTEYTGEVPAGYSSLEDWANNANIRAYKLVDGNLVLDVNRDYKLKILFDEEAFANGYVTRREMGITSTDEINPYANLYCSKDAFSIGYIARSNEETVEVGNIPTEEVQLNSYVTEEQKLDLIEVEFIGNNFLPNTATSTSNNGISYRQNIDKTITATGTATDKSILNLAGTDTSVRNILTFKGDYKAIYDGETVVTEHNNYHLSGLADGVNVEFYRYNGTDRILIGIYTNNDVISFADNTNVTQVILTVDSGVTVNTTLKPMLRLVEDETTTEYEYEEYKNNTTLIDMKGYSIGMYDIILIRDNQVFIKRNGYYTEEQLQELGIEYEYKLLGNVSMPRAYTPYTYAYCHQNIDLRFTYKDPRNIDMSKIDLNGTLSINKVEAESITVNSASIEETISVDSEIATTTFLNGKRVYKRLYRGVMPSTAGSTVNLFVYDMDCSQIWVDESMSFIYSTNETLGINWWFASNDYIRTLVNKGLKCVRYKSGGNLSSFSYNIVLAYTKNDASVDPEVEPDTPISYQSKTISANGAKGHHKFTLQVNEDGINGNASTVNYSFKLSAIQKGWNWSDWGSSISYSITIGDNRYTGTIPKYDGSSTITLKSGSGIAIEHDADGSKTIPISFTVTDGTGQSYTCGNASSSASMTLTTIQ